MTPQPSVFPGVRIASAADEVSLFSLLTLMHSENGLFPMNPEKVLARVRLGTQGQGGIIGVIDGPAGIEASVGMFFSSQWFTDSIHVEEAWCFVRPEHRKTYHAKTLIEFAKWTQGRLGVPLVMGLLTKRRLGAKLRLYQRQLKQVGAIFYHGLPTEEFFAQKMIAESTSKHDVDIAAAVDNRAA